MTAPRVDTDELAAYEWALPCDWSTDTQPDPCGATATHSVGVHCCSGAMLSVLQGGQGHTHHPYLLCTAHAEVVAERMRHPTNLMGRCTGCGQRCRGGGYFINLQPLKP